MDIFHLKLYDQIISALEKVKIKQAEINAVGGVEGDAVSRNCKRSCGGSSDASGEVYSVHRGSCGALSACNGVNAQSVGSNGNRGNVGDFYVVYVQIILVITVEMAEGDSNCLTGVVGKVDVLLLPRGWGLGTAVGVQCFFKEESEVSGIGPCG